MGEERLTEGLAPIVLSNEINGQKIMHTKWFVIVVRREATGVEESASKFQEKRTLISCLLKF